MNFDLSEEQKLLQEQVRRLLERHDVTRFLRAIPSSGKCWDPALWQLLRELGLPGASVPERQGGLGLSFVNACLVASELGRVVAPVPFFSSVCLAIEALKMAGRSRVADEWLPKLASGETIGTLALNEKPGEPGFAAITTEFADGKLHGSKIAVPDAQLAQICMTFARQNGKTVLALAALDQPQVTIEPLEGFDFVRPHATIRFDGAVAAVLDIANVDEALRRLLDQAAVACAFEQIGGAEACLWMARDYALQRSAFGRSIASYQAIKHKLADIYISIELARSNAFFAAWALDHDSSELPAAAAAARLAATEAYEMSARENLQTHGGIGFTWDADCHFHYRRSRLLSVALGTPAFWNERLFSALEQTQRRSA